MRFGVVPSRGGETAGARLHEAFARARSGERCVALVTGEAGIGKTRLLAEFAHAVQRAGALVLYGRCEEEPATPYQPFAEALAPLAVPDVLADGLGELTAGRPGEPASDPEADRARMFDAVAEWLEEVAASAAACARPGRPALGGSGHAAPACAAWRLALSASLCSCSGAPGTSSYARATR